MKIAVSGLGRMGGQIARKLAEGGHEVIAHNRSHEPIDEAVSYGATAAYNKADVVSQFGATPTIIWIMIPAEIIDSELDDWLSILPPGSIIIDGGNSGYRGDQARDDKVAAKGSTLLDIGTSCGVWRYENGFSMMTGGDQAAYQTISPALETLSLPRGGHQHFSTNGSGHYVKMVHNAIEYGMMESLAEGYRMLKEGPYKNLDLVSAGEVWQKRSVITSWLNELTVNALKENPNLEGVDG